MSASNRSESAVIDELRFGIGAVAHLDLTGAASAP